MVVNGTLVVEGKAGFDLRLGVREQLYSYLHATEWRSTCCCTLVQSQIPSRGLNEHCPYPANPLILRPETQNADA